MIRTRQKEESKPWMHDCGYYKTAIEVLFIVRMSAEIENISMSFISF
jgi:hypothetical protein